MSDEQITQLINIEDGSLAKAKPLRQNFKFLDDNITANTIAINNLRTLISTTVNTAVNGVIQNFKTQPSTNYINGFTITKTNNSTISVTKGSCYDSTKTYILSIENDATVENLSLSANATYYVFIIGKAPSSGLYATDCYIIVTPTQNPTSSLPLGYTHYLQIGTYTTNGDGNIAETDYHVQELMLSDIQKMLSYKKPKMTALVDWDTMQTLTTTTIRTTNATTGITYWNGTVPAASASYRQGDILLKEEFTNYPRLMVVFSNSNGTYLESTIWESWELNYILSQNKGQTNLLKEYSSQTVGYFWFIYGYQYTNSGFTAVTTKTHLMCNNSKNAGLVEIYGLEYTDEE